MITKDSIQDERDGLVPENTADAAHAVTPVYYFLFKSVNSSVYCPQHYDTGFHIHASSLFH
jgi:hypothetical protein